MAYGVTTTERSDPNVLLSDLSQVVTEYGRRREHEEDENQDEIIPVISCCILVLFVIMIILLLLVSSYYINDYVDDTNTPKATYKPPMKGDPAPTATSSITSAPTGPGPIQSSTPGTTPPVVTNGTHSPRPNTSSTSSGPVSIGTGNLTRRPPASTPITRPSVFPTPPTASPVSTRGPGTQTTAARTVSPGMTSRSTARTMTSTARTTRSQTTATTSRRPPATTGMTASTGRTTTSTRTLRSTTATTRRTTSTTTRTTTTRTTSTRRTTVRTTTSTTTSPMSTTPGYNHTPRPGKPTRNFTLICVFEYLTGRRQLWEKVDQCTDYVYMRVFTYFDDKKINHEPLTFTQKTLKPWVFNAYFDTNATYWQYLDEGHREVRVVMEFTYPHADWYIGMWGSTFLRLLTNFWEVEKIRDSLHSFLRQPFIGSINTSRFDGFAIINTIIRSTRGDHQIELTVNRSIFRGPRNPIIPSGWSYLHTAAVWPGGDRLIPERHVKNFFGVADIVGLSTSNTTDEPNLVQQAMYSPGFYWASPPNPIHPPYPGMRGMLDALREFPHWKTVLNRRSICFSVSSAINYAKSSGATIDFKQEMPSRTDAVQRYTRFRFTTRVNGTYPVEELKYKYEFDNTTHTHFWKGLFQRNLTGFFAYDDASTLKYKMEKLLDAYPDDRCVVFDDLGDDYHEMGFTYDNHTVQFKKYELLHAVASTMVQRYGPAFGPQYY